MARAEIAPGFLHGAFVPRRRLGELARPNIRHLGRAAMVIALLRGPGFLLRPCSGPCYFSAVFQISRALLQLLHLAAPPLQGFTGAFAQQEKYSAKQMRQHTDNMSDFHDQVRCRNFAVGDVVIDVFAGQMLAGFI